MLMEVFNDFCATVYYRVEINDIGKEVKVGEGYPYADDNLRPGIPASEWAANEKIREQEIRDSDRG